MYRVGIIGLGSIASRYSTPDDAYPYCHTGGIRFCETTELVAVADMSEERQTEFQQVWGPAFPDNSINYYETDTQMLESGRFGYRCRLCARTASFQGDAKRLEGGHQSHLPRKTRWVFS